jgi:hypothetical protein
MNVVEYETMAALDLIRAATWRRRLLLAAIISSMNSCNTIEEYERSLGRLDRLAGVEEVRLERAFEEAPQEIVRRVRVFAVVDALKLHQHAMNAL